jgi:hypothetical protein
LDETPATAKVSPADELLLPASGGAAPASSPGASAAAGAIASDAVAPAVPDKIGVPVGFGDMSSGPDGFKP